MYNYITKIKDEPAFAGLPLDTTFFLVILFCCFQHAFCKRVKHAVARPVADHEIISKGCDVCNVQKQNVFALFVLQGFNDFMSKFKCVQISPLVLVCHCEPFGSEAISRDAEDCFAASLLAMTLLFL